MHSTFRPWGFRTLDITLAEKSQQLLARWSEALATDAFRNRHVTVATLSENLPTAIERSLQRLIQALFREGLLDPDTCVHDEPFGCWIPLGADSGLQFDYLRPGRMNSWDLRGAVTFHQAGCPTTSVIFGSQLMTLLRKSLSPAPTEHIVERLNHELDDSLGNETLCLAFNQQWTRQLFEQLEARHGGNFLLWLANNPLVANPTALLEQWGTLGHPWHPNYKTKLGLSATQVIGFSPEFESRFPVFLGALHRQFAHVESMPGSEDHWSWWQKRFPQAAQKLAVHLGHQGLDPNDYLPLPVHPWQVENHLQRIFAAEINDRLLVLTDIVAFSAHPTMSFRTVLPDGSVNAPMVKLPVAMKLTSAQRTVSPRAVRMGPRISHLIMKILAREPGIQAVLNILPERTGVHFSPENVNDERSRHAAALYRDNPLTTLKPGELAIPVGSFFALDHQGQPLLRHCVQLAQGGDDTPALLAFFNRYLSVAVPGVLEMYLRYGVAFEAHQQNSFMIINAHGMPDRLLLRDFGDLRIERKVLRAQGLAIELHDPLMTLYEDSGFVRDKLLHAFFMCHLGELVLLCARHWDTPASTLWNELARQVKQCFDNLRANTDAQRWNAERRALLEEAWPAKSLLRMRLLDSQLDIVGRLKNPLFECADER